MSIEQKFGVLIPCEADHFSSFISSLLGKPQTIERMILGAHEINREDIKNLYLLVHQRIQQQNEANLIQFSVNIFYDDSSSVMLNSYEEFSTYNEVRSLASVGATLSWTYLIKFKNKEVPEKQEISVSLHSGFAESRAFENDIFIPISMMRRGGLINFRISHTERTWGNDIESLLTGHLNTLLRPISKIKKVTTKHSNLIGFTFGSFLYLISLIGAAITTNSVISTYLERLSKISENIQDTNLLTKKIDFLLEIITTGAWTKYSFSLAIFLIASLVFSIFFAVTISVQLEKPPQSHLLLTRKSVEIKDTQDKALRRDWLMLCLSIVLGVIGGIVANLLFGKFFIHLV